MHALIIVVHYILNQIRFVSFYSIISKSQMMNLVYSSELLIFWQYQSVDSRFHSGFIPR